MANLKQILAQVQTTADLKEMVEKLLKQKQIHVSVIVENQELGDRIKVFLPDERMWKKASEEIKKLPFMWSHELPFAIAK